MIYVPVWHYLYIIIMSIFNNISQDFYYKGEQKVEQAIKVYETFIKNEFDLNDYLIEDTL